MPARAITFNPTAARCPSPPAANECIASCHSVAPGTAPARRTASKSRRAYCQRPALLHARMARARSSPDPEEPCCTEASAAAAAVAVSTSAAASPIPAPATAPKFEAAVVAVIAEAVIAVIAAIAVIAEAAVGGRLSAVDVSSRTRSAMSQLLASAHAFSSATSAARSGSSPRDRISSSS